MQHTAAQEASGTFIQVLPLVVPALKTPISSQLPAERTTFFPEAGGAPQIDTTRRKW